MELQPFDNEIWTGRIDYEDGKLGIRIHQIIQKYSDQSNGKVLLGFCSEEGVKRNKGRLGAKSAPNEIRKMMANLPVHTNELKVYDFGNLVVDEDLEEATNKQVQLVSSIITNHSFPVVIGGGHETALGTYLGFIKHYPKNSLVINIDAHFDIRKPNPISTSGTPFYEMNEYCKSNNLDFNYLVLGIQEPGNTKALFHRADEMQIEYVLADEIHANFNRVLEDLKVYIEKFEHIYLSLDMDVFDVAYAPGVSATTINGLTPFQVKYLIKFLKKTEKIKVFDLVEVNPLYDRDNQTSKLAAQMIYEVLKD